MKILGVYNGSGGEYHRVKLPLSYIKEDVVFTETLTEEIIKDADIIYIHWNSPVSIPILSVWQSKYKFKVIADIDDTWDLSNIFKKTIFQSRNLCRFADAVICTNEYIRQQIVEFNKMVFVIPNYLPNDGQFTFKDKPTTNKLHIGIGGSISHYQDWLLLKKHIKRIEKDFGDNIQWHLIGIDDNPLCKDIINMMPKSTIKYRNIAVENYMQLYDNFDVMLCPLADSSLAKGRSALKVYECLHAGVVPIISEFYIKKDNRLRDLPIANWYNNIKSFITRKYLGLEIVKNLRKSIVYNYQDDCVIARICIFADVLNTHCNTNYKHELYSIKYQENQLVEYTPYFNSIKTIEERSYLFEYNPIIKIVENSTTNEYIGIFSHRFPNKTGFYKKYVEEILDNEDSDVITFCKQTPTYLAWTEQQHPGFMNVFQKVCDKLDLIVSEPRCTIYSNFFVAKSHIYKEYVQLLQRAIDQAYLKSQFPARKC